MPQKVAGNIVIKLSAGSGADQFQNAMTKAAASTKAFGGVARGMGSDLKSSVAQMRSASEEAAKYATAILLGAKAVTTQVTATTALEAALNRLRAARIGVAAYVEGIGGAAVAGMEIAAVVAIEKIARSTYARAKEIQQTALRSQKAGFSYQDTEGLTFAAKRIDKPPDFFDSAVRSAGGIDQLSKKLQELNQIQDPVARIDVAFKTFGADTEKILPLLGSRFAENIARAKDWGFALDDVSRSKIDGFNRDLKDLKNTFDSLGDSIAASKQNFLSLLQVDFAGLYSVVIGGTGDLIGKIRTAAGNVIYDPMTGFKGITQGAQKSVQQRQSQDMLATAQKDMLKSLTAPAEKSFQKSYFGRDQETALRAEIEELQKKLFVADRTSPNFGKLVSGAQYPGGYGAQAESLQKLSSAQGRLSRVLEAKKDEEDAEKRLKAQAESAKHLKDVLQSLSAELDGAKAKLAAIGQGAGAEAAAKSLAAGYKVLEELDKEHVTLPKFTGPRQPGVKPADWDTQGQILYKENLIGQTEAEATWEERLKSSTAAMSERIRSQELLTAAIGKGYEATKRATVDAGAVSFLGKEYGNPDWLGQGSAMDTEVQKQHRSALDAHKEQAGREFDTRHAEDTAKTLDSLQEQIELEKALAAVQREGAEAVRQAALAMRLQKLAQDDDAASAKKLIAAEIELYNAERANRIAETVANLDQENAALQRVTAAVWGGAEATRKAGLENKYVAMQRDLGVPADAPVIQKERTKDEAAHQGEVSAEAAKMATSYQDSLDHISQLTEKLQQQKATQGETLGITIALRDLENQRLKTLAEMSLQMGTVKDGVRAFFLDMQQNSQKAATTIYEAMHSALDKASNELANVMTGQKTSWSKMFLDIGHELEKNAIKSALQTGLGKLGKPAGGVQGTQGTLGKIGSALGLGSAGTPDGSTASKALWVRMATATGTPIQNVGLPAPKGGVSQPGNVLFGNGGLLGTGGIPTVDIGAGVSGKPDGTLSNPVGVMLAPNGTSPDGSAGNPFYVVVAQGGFGSKPVDLGPNQKPADSSGPNGVQTAGGIITGIANAVGGIMAAKGGANAPPRASGGTVYRGKTQLVGEKGPELFTSAMDGHIVDHETTKRLARAGVLPGLKIPGVSAAPKRLTPRAEGGDVSAGDSYLVGEKGFEAFGPTSFSADQGSRRTQASAGNVYYSIDARGTDPVLTEQRMRKALIEVHGSAVVTAIQGNIEHTKRTPARS